MDPLGCDDDVFRIASFKEKIFKRCETSLTRGRNCNGVEVSNDFWTLTVFLTPPTSPNHSPNQASSTDERDQRLFVNVNDNLAEDDEVFKPRSTKDLTSMLIRDCMWNGEAANKTGSFEKLRPLTKTPPLVDCNLVAYVDPSEIWPFSLAKEIKGENKTIREETKPNGNDCTADEDVEVDVVGLEGAQKVPVKKDEASVEKEAKLCVAVKCEDESPPLCCDEKPVTTPLTPSTSDDEYACKLRSCIKRRRTSSVEIDQENDQKMRVSSGEESDQDCEVGRATHNVLERKRRNELKQRFQYLRDSIPELTGNDRAPKVAILQKAFSYITFLKAQEKSLIEEQKTLKNQLLKRVLELQNHNHHAAVF